MKNTIIEVIGGDITEMDTEAIVNAANERLAHGGGVAGAIVRKGGKVIQEESNSWVKEHGKVRTGSAAITTGGALKAKYVIHAVGPVMGSGYEDSKLKNATYNSLKLADEYGINSISFPAISTGIFGYPVNRCAKNMLSTVKQYVMDEETNIQRVVFCLWGEDALSVFEKELEQDQ